MSVPLDAEALVPARRRWLRTMAMLALAVASVGYMIVALREAPAALRGVHWLAHPGLLAAGLALQAVALSLGSLLWWVVLNRLAPGAITPRRLWRIWAITNPARYVPGRIWHITSLGALMLDAGVPVAATLTSVAMHMWLFMLAGSLTGALLLLQAPLSPPLRATIAGAILAGVAVGCHPRLLRLGSALLGRLSRQPALPWSGTWGQGLALGAAHVGIHLLNGVAACLLLRATVGLAPGEAVRVVAATAAAFLVGYVSLVPAGLGVREAAMTLMLTPAASTPAAAAGALVLRTAATLVELLLAAVATLGPLRRRLAAR